MLDFGFYNMDCLKGMREFPNKYFDLAVVDPPYSEKEKRYDSPIKHGAGHWKYSDVFWDIAPSQEYFDELFRISKNQIIWGGNYFQLPKRKQHRQLGLIN